MTKPKPARELTTQGAMRRLFPVGVRAGAARRAEGEREEAREGDMSFESSPARRGLDLLLAQAPHLDLLKAEWQAEGPWLLVTLGQRSAGVRETWARHRYAIFTNTGAVHGLQQDGAVTDDPILQP
jgi:hypothetical protein